MTKYKHYKDKHYKKNSFKTICRHSKYLLEKCFSKAVAESSDCVQIGDLKIKKLNADCE